MFDGAKFFVTDMYDNLIVWHRTQREIKKYKDCKRRNIYEKVSLSEEQKKQIDDFYIENYGKKIPYTWHRHFTAFTGKFDYRYFPELLYIPKFEHYMNYRISYTDVMSDKNFLPLIAKSGGIKTPIAFVSKTSGFYRNKEYQHIDREQVSNIIKDIGEVFVKPTVETCSGEGCFVMNIVNGVDTISGRPAMDILDELENNWTLQERIICHETIRAIYAGSVNTFRIITYRWKDEIHHCKILMRIGKGGNYLDNAHAGGMFIAVDDDGKIHDVAFTEFNIRYEEHPDTGMRFKGYKIPLVAEALKSAIKMHELIPQVGIVNWDFTIYKDGSPVLIEANMKNGSIWLSEMAHGKAAFGDDTAEILQWIRFMEKVPAHMRYKYQFGKME